MFTGLIQIQGVLERRDRGQGGLRFHIRAAWDRPLVEGESIAVNGACLTAADIQGDAFVCDVLEETVARTNLGGKQPGFRLNLERALKVGDALGGHWVSGHVDGLGRLLEHRRGGRDGTMRFACAPDLLRGLVQKGSIAVDGISLTVAGLDERSFTVCLIPYTWDHTSLGALNEGDTVNLETDLIGKYVFRYLQGRDVPSGITEESLRRAGFGE